MNMLKMVIYFKIETIPIITSNIFVFFFPKYVHRSYYNVPFAIFYNCETFIQHQTYLF